MKDDAILKWLLQGDIAIQYQTYRDLLSEDRQDLRDRIESEGWGKRFMSKRHADGHWGRKFYQPKWISSHYTLLDLRNLGIDPVNKLIQASVNNIADNEKGPDGGINPAVTIPQSDVCVNGMFLNYASYFQCDSERLKSVIDFILMHRMPDGGYNCWSNRSGAKHSSLHTTLSILEGITEYEQNGYTYRLDELKEAERSSKEFILLHQLYISDRTGEVINKDFLRLTYPGRWKYDILKALDYFQYSATAWDDRMEPAIQVLLKKRNTDGTWNLQANHPGQVHFEMEKTRRPSRWNTLRALRVLNHFGKRHSSTALSNNTH